MWKHKTKWLVRGGRKVRCYLCGKKILAKGDLFLFHQDTGYYSHQSCMTESTTISGNERRRAVKKIAVGAAIVGAIAAGAGKLIDISSQSKGSLNSPDTQTILTSQGLILPALTSDPANPVAGQMWYRSDKGVTAHFDAIENRVIYSNRIVDGSVVVTSKGIVNGLSVLPNDGQDWGPDTTKGATAPGQYGSPYTETSGIQEAANTSPNSIDGYPAGYIKLGSGIFNIKSNIQLYGCSLIGNGAGSTYYGFGGGTFLYAVGSSMTAVLEIGTVNSQTVYQGNMIKNMAIGTPPSVTATSSTIDAIDNWSGEESRYENLTISKMNRAIALLNGNYASDTYSGTGQSNVNIVPYGVKVYNLRIEACNYGIYDTAWGGNFFTDIYCERTVNVSYTISTQTESDLLINIYDEVNTGALSLVHTGVNFLLISNAQFIGTVKLEGTNGGSINGMEFNSSVNLEVSGTGYIMNGLKFYSGTIVEQSGATANIYASPKWSATHTAPTINSGSLIIGVLNPATDLPSASISANPPVSGTAYQNTNPYDIEIDLPVYATTSGTAGYVTIAKGSTSTPTAIGNQFVSGSTSSTSVDIIRLRVPANWYYKFTGSGVTFGTASVFAD